MKKEIKKTVIVSILALGLLTGPALAQNSNTTQPQQQMNGNMQGGGMMGGGMQGGMMGGEMKGMGMHGQGMMGGKQGNWGGMGCNGMMGGAMMNQMTPDQQQSFMSRTTDLRKEMMALRFDYQEVMRNPDADPKDLAEIEKQMLELRTKMMGKMQNLQAQ